MMPSLTRPDHSILCTASPPQGSRTRSALFHFISLLLLLPPTIKTLLLLSLQPVLFPEWDELRMGRVVGRGGFCFVREVQALKLHNQKKSSSRRRTPSARDLFSRTDSNDKDDGNNNVSSRDPVDAVDVVQTGQVFRFG